MSKIVGYRLEWKPGDCIFETPEAYEEEICKAGAKVWSLHEQPQPGCDPEIVVYRGTHWIRPKHVYNKNMVGFKPLYLGPIVHDPLLWQDAFGMVPANNTYH